MKNRKLIILTVSFLILIILSNILQYYYFRVKDKQQEKTSEVYGVLQIDGNGNWYILEDADHKSKGIKFIRQFPDRIEIYYDEKYTGIFWSAFTPDETLTVLDIDLGASVGLDKSIIYMAKSGGQINPNTINNQQASIWLYISGKE